MVGCPCPTDQTAFTHRAYSLPARLLAGAFTRAFVATVKI